MSRTSLIVYHAGCVDGFTSAWVVYTENCKNGVNSIFLPAGYNAASYDSIVNKAKEIRAHEVIIVDFSVPIETLEVLNDLFPSTTVSVLDHHKTAFELYDQGHKVNPTSSLYTVIHGATITLNNSDCGSSLAWKMLSASAFDHVPELIKYVRDYDLWKFEYGDATRYVNKVLALYLREEKDISTLLHLWDLAAAALERPLDRKEFLAEGKHLQEEHDREVQAACDDAKPYLFRSHTAFVTHCEPHLASSVGNELAKRKPGAVGITYCIDYSLPTKPLVKYSLRSIGDTDVSKLAKYYGGGGHKNAAGFVSAGMPAALLGLEEVN